MSHRATVLDVIRDLDAYRRVRVDRERQTLRALTMERSIAHAEALLCSSLVTDRPPTTRPRALNLARVLGIHTGGLPVCRP